MLFLKVFSFTLNKKALCSSGSGFLFVCFVCVSKIYFVLFEVLQFEQGRVHIIHPAIVKTWSKGRRQAP